ncbi:pyridoxal-phosphate dependent enzyme [Crossiella sp. CA-258035]|uniref:1-aminocyclopropane-1-carboxylate deaminase/D-cysteine desulfhydrase n=1 Tax=Crossiella sp. CA-258035 TaxID=2981138 RepID=UPI0024BC53C0|nr:pyridoxal-phosphate dependent enzyme [Crossiella sp. CA-258035]WHT20228.1 pyridoxal-phosphate dependent enzyme [Crossiella sp. CA-258035]
MPLPDLRLPSPLVELTDERAQRRGVAVYLKRDDLIHPELRGNKWRKLQHNITAAKEQGFTQLLTFGGAYSNHVPATASAGRHFGFATVGVIRGEEHLPLNDNLALAVSRGMTLSYLDRQTYRSKTEPKVLQRLHEEFGDFYYLPEGGSNALALKGCAELPTEITVPFDVICCAVGTGGTLAGIAHGLRKEQCAIGFAALKGGDFLNAEVDQLQRDAFGAASGNWHIETEFHFGGFAKRKPELDDFIADFQARHGIQLDWVYVAKMLYGVFALIDRGRFEPGTRLIAVISG